MTPLVLGVLAVLLAGPVPAALSRIGALLRAPRAAITLWQAVALAAVLAGLGAGLAVASQVLLDKHLAWPWDLARGFALLVTTVVLGRLLLTAHRVGLRTRQLRRRHRELVDLLADDAAGVRVVPHETPTAYCLPGFHRSRIVLSDSTLQSLGASELDAVLAHERAHLRARHDLVLEAFTVLNEAFPRVVHSRVALDRVRLLIEILADDAAVRRCGRRALAQALVRLAGGTRPAAALGIGGGDVLLRVHRLAEPARPARAVAAAAYLAALSVVCLPTALVAVPWLTEVVPRLLG
jgi:Zn-dependent protease with chaperone function